LTGLDTPIYLSNVSGTVSTQQGCSNMLVSCSKKVPIPIRN